MKLTPLQRLDLNDELDNLLQKLPGAKGIQLLDINDQIDEVLVKLGYGTIDQPPAPAAPEIVSKFIAGEFSKQKDDDFVSTLNALDEFVGVYISLDDIKSGAITWINQRAA